MRKLLLLLVTLLSLSVAPAAFSQGVQTESAPNATPPGGTVPNASNGVAPRVGSARHHRRAHRHAVTSRRPVEQSVPEQQSR